MECRLTSTLLQRLLLSLLWLPLQHGWSLCSCPGHATAAVAARTSLSCRQFGAFLVASSQHHLIYSTSFAHCAQTDILKLIYSCLSISKSAFKRKNQRCEFLMLAILRPLATSVCFLHLQHLLARCAA